MTDLVPCPLCGGSDGYCIGNAPGTKSLISLNCVLCRQLIATLENELGSDIFCRCDTAWNEAGAYAEGLRVKVAELRELCRYVHDRILRGDSDGELLKLLEDGSHE